MPYKSISRCTADGWQLKIHKNIKLKETPSMTMSYFNLVEEFMVTGYKQGATICTKATPEVLWLTQCKPKWKMEKNKTQKHLLQQPQKNIKWSRSIGGWESTGWARHFLLCQKRRKHSRNDGDMSQRHRRLRKGLPIIISIDSCTVAFDENILSFRK